MKNLENKKCKLQKENKNNKNNLIDQINKYNKIEKMDRKIQKENIDKLRFNIYSHSIEPTILRYNETVEPILSSTGKKQFPINIIFNNNEIQFCQEEIENKPNQILFDHFVERMIQQPNEYHMNEFEYQQKKYNFHDDSLLYLICWYFLQTENKQKISQSKIIINVAEYSDYKQMKRFRKIFKTKTKEDQTEIDKTLQKEHKEVEELLWNYCQFEYCQRIFDKAQQIMKSTTNEKLKEKKELLLNIINFNDFYSVENIKQIVDKFSLEEQQELHFDKMFEIFEEWKKENLIPMMFKEKKEPKQKENIKENSCYPKESTMTKLKQSIGYYQYLSLKGLKECKELSFDEIVYTRKDRKIDYRNLKQLVKQSKDEETLKHLIIPDGVKSIEENCFKNDHYLDRITLPTTLTKLNKNAFYSCDISKFYIPPSVKEIDDQCFMHCNIKLLSLPSTLTRIGTDCFKKCSIDVLQYPEDNKHKVIGNQIALIENNHCILNGFGSIKRIGNKQVNQITEMFFPLDIKSFELNCFNKYNSIKQITFPMSLNSIDKRIFECYPQINSINAPKWKKVGNRMFKINNNVLYSFKIPLTIKKINDKEIEGMFELKKYTLPTFVTKLSDYCFENCFKLSKIKGLEHITEIGKGCFFNCPELNKDVYSQKLIGDKKQYDLTDKQIEYLEKWSELQANEIVFDSDRNDWNRYTSIFDKKIYGKSNLMFIFEDSENNKFGCFLSNRIAKIVKNNPPYSRNSFKSTSFYFNLQINNEKIFSPNKFPTMRYDHFGIVGKYPRHELFISGGFEIKKQYMKEQCSCQINNILGKNNFDMKRIMVIQMDITKEQREVIEQQKLLNDNLCSKTFEEYKKKYEKELKQIEKWTSKKCSEMLFDSNIYEIKNSKMLNERIIGKKQLTFIIEDEDGEIFGYYFNPKIEFTFDIIHSDDKTFIFNVHSVNNRLETPMKFNISYSMYSGLQLFSDDDPDLIRLGDITLKTDKYVALKQDSCNFDYEEIENVLTGKEAKSYGFPTYFRFVRVVVIQMK